VSGDRPFWQSKRVYEIVVPFALTAPIALLYLFVDGLFKDGFLGRFLDLLFQFMVFVVPFHLAALAAFATFERQGLDEPLKGTNAEVEIWSNKQNSRIVKTLTLRQYASLMFGYLCSIGVIFIIAYLFLDSINTEVIPSVMYLYLYPVGVICSLFFVFHYATLTAYAITFLFEKINKIEA
tara:strand:+ start:1400 stop:1939 length:540 start_codon:yes stop_codon:yes gene_type:complete